MQRILRLEDGAEVSAKIQKNGLYGTGSGIDSEQQWFHFVPFNRSTKESLNKSPF
jgi:hypothetical protein